MKKSSLILLFYCIFFGCNPEKQATENQKEPSEITDEKELDNEPIRSIQNLEIPQGATGQVIQYEGFTVSYNEKHEQANWVAYHLTKEEVENEKVERKNNFRGDKQVETGSAIPADYKKSGYDRGHLAPAADMKWSKKAMSESFYMTNMSPQEKEFNRGIWRSLEEQCREWAIENKSIYVVTGGILKGRLKKIGKNKVSVPKYYYKVILDYEEPEIKAIAFLMKNKDADDAELREFVVPIDRIEEETGFDFFPELKDKLEDNLEGANNPEKWGL